MRTRRFYDQATKDAAVRMRAEGLSARAIANELDMDYSTVSRLTCHLRANRACGQCGRLIAWNNTAELCCACQETPTASKNAKARAYTSPILCKPQANPPPESHRDALLAHYQARAEAGLPLFAGDKPLPEEAGRVEYQGVRVSRARLGTRYAQTDILSTDRGGDH